MVQEKTKVIFRVYPEGDIIALMPDIPGTNKGNDCESYMHLGQHAAAHYNGVCQETRKAHKEEYQALYDELTSAPFNYDFQVIKNYRHRKGML